MGNQLQPIARRNKQISDYDFTKITDHGKNNVTKYQIQV